MKKRILAVIEKTDDAMAWYRSVLPLLRLKASGSIDVDFMMVGNRPTWDLLVQYDILFMQRPHDVKYVDLAGLARLHRLKVWLDFDDPLWSLNPDSPAHSYYQQESTREAISRCIDLSDVISVSTTELADSVMEYYKKEAVVIRNAADLSGLQWMSSTLKKESRALCWRGSHTHMEDVMAFKGEMDALDKEYENISWRFYGADMYFAKKGLRNVTQVGYMDFTLYQQTLRVDDGQIMFIPLGDNHFNRCKSDIAAIESVVAGMIPVVPEWWLLGINNGSMSGTIKYLLGSDRETKEKIWKEMCAFVVDCRNLTIENLKRIALIEGL